MSDNQLASIFQTPGFYTLGPDPNATLRSIADSAVRFGNIDCVVCVRPAAVCEAAWSLGKRSIVYVAERLEKAREAPRRWRQVLSCFGNMSSCAAVCVTVCEAAWSLVK